MPSRGFDLMGYVEITIFDNKTKTNGIVMNNRLIISLLMPVFLGIGGCRNDSCVVQGSVKGIQNGAVIQMMDAWNNYEVIDSTVVKDGTFVFRPAISRPTHVYLYQEHNQLKDFILERGTIHVDIIAGDEMDPFSGAAGTISNNRYQQLRQLALEGEMDAMEDLRMTIISAEKTGPLALFLADGMCRSSAEALGVLDRLSPDLANIPYVETMRAELSRRIRTEPRADGSDYIPLFIDMEYPDSDGNLISLGSVVNNPGNRYVLLDFWATWCDPCVASLPQLKEVYATYHGKGFEIYSVSEDPSDKRWKPFLKENDMNWINVLDVNAGRKDSKVWEDYALNGIPTVLLIDGNTGEIIARDNHLDLDTILSVLLP